MTTPAEPILIGGHSVFVKFFAMPRQADDPKRIEGTFTLVGSEGVLTLDALVGPQGVPGEPSPIIRPQWGSTVTDPEDLPDTATLDESDDGRAWYIDGSWHIYSDADGDYHIVQGSIPGPVGVTPDITITAEQIEAEDPLVYGAIEVDETGTSTAPNFHFKIPGVPGPEGPSAAIETASDYDDTVTAEDGDFLVFDGDTEKWHPSSPNIIYPKRWTIPEANFISHTGSEGRFLIASLNIPAQDFDYYPDVVGHVRVRRSGLLSSAQIEVEVRIGNTGAGTGEDQPLCGLAPYDPTTILFDSVTIAHILPHFSDTGDPIRSISPDTEEGRVPSGTAKTLYIFIHKLGGSGSYEFTTGGAQLRVDILPVI